jgi:ABC-type nitrate/sulfonate/bicarbonate transport system permease component
MIKRWLFPWQYGGMFLAILMLWQSLSGLDIFPYHILPSPLQVLKGFYETCSVGVPPTYTLPRHIAESLGRVFLGFLALLISGISCGILIGWLPVLRELLMIPVGVIRPIPPLA